MEQERLIPVSPLTFEREMTSVFLELWDELSQERMEKRMAEYRAGLPSQPKVEPVNCVLAQKEPDKVFLPAVRQEPQKPLPSIKTDAPPKVCVPVKGGKLPENPLRLPPKLAVAIPGQVQKQESVQLDLMEASSGVTMPEIRLEERGEKGREAGVPLKLEPLPAVAMPDTPPQVEDARLKLEPPPTVTMPGVPVPVDVKPLAALLVKRPVTLRGIRLPEEGGPLSLRYPDKFEIPRLSEHGRPEVLEFNTPDKIAMKPVQLLGKAEPLKIQRLFAVAIPERTERHPVTPLALPKEEKVVLPAPALPESVELVKVNLPESASAWLDLNRPFPMVESPPFIAMEPETATIPEPPPNLMELWEKMGGPATLLADLERLLSKRARGASDTAL